jgi:hypothetical protein
MVQMLKIHKFMSFYFSWARKIKRFFHFSRMHGIPAARFIHNTSSSK